MYGNLSDLIINSSWTSLVIEFVHYNPNTPNLQIFTLNQYAFTRGSAGNVNPVANTKNV